MNQLDLSSALGDVRDLLQFSIFLCIWITLSAAVAVRAKQRGLNVVGMFVLSLFLSPLIGLFVIAIARDQLKACPFCAERVKLAARRCPYCAADFPAPDRSRPLSM
ncbi:MAG: hypothetical protein ACLP1Y_09100 [Candidatus Acidiferrales bacterium]